MAPVISRAWIGYSEPDFLFFFVILAIGGLVNILYAPSYFANLGIGDLKLNATGQVITAALNMGLGLFLGMMYGGEAVVVAWVISWVVGSLSMLLLFHYKNRISFSRLFPKEYIFLGLGGVIGVFMSLSLIQLLNDRLSTFALTGVILMAVFLSSSLPIWHHTMRKRLTRWLIEGIINESKAL
jgi:O-antigen/teichoic acid export membrane protein